MNDRPIIEPSAEVRAAAHQLRETFIALTFEGFSEAQAIAILGAMLAASQQ